MSTQAKMIFMDRDTRSLLISVAGDLLDQGGTAAVTLREVGKLAGVSHNAPYKHFTDKEDLLASIAAAELLAQAEALGKATASIQTERALREAMQQYLSWAKSYPQRFNLAFGTWTRDNTELGEAASAAQLALLHLVVVAQTRGCLPQGDPGRLALLLMALANGAANLSLNGHLGPAKGGVEAENLMDDLLRYLEIIAETSNKPKTKKVTRAHRPAKKR